MMRDISRERQFEKRCCEMGRDMEKREEAFNFALSQLSGIERHIAGKKGCSSREREIQELYKTLKISFRFALSRILHLERNNYALRYDLEEMGKCTE